MARIVLEPASVAGVRTNPSGSPISGTIIGVELLKEIPQGYTVDGTTVTPHGEVKIRPTNVTATVGESVDESDSFILLHNGPKGGFTQNYNGTATTLFFNSVVRAVITDG